MPGGKPGQNIAKLTDMVPVYAAWVVIFIQTL